MTDAFEILERSLRDGPPDELGYRAQPLDLPHVLASDGSIRAIRLDRVVSVRTKRRTEIGSSWRFLAAVVVVAVSLAAVGIVGLRDRLGLVGPASGPSAITIPPLSEAFTSPRNGFSIRYPAGWTVTPATASWPPDIFLPEGHPALDRFIRPGTARLVVASQRLGVGQTEDDFVAAYVEPYPGPNQCVGPSTTWPRLAIGGASGYLIGADCQVPLDNRVADRDVAFRAFAFSGGRVYEIRLDGDVDLAYFKAILATVRLTPSSAVD
jgi:hypothetical protein